VAPGEEFAMRRTLAWDAPVAALALGLVQGVLGLALGQRVPPRVALASFAVEAGLAWISLALLVGVVALVPGLRRAASDRGSRQALLLVALGGIVGGSWLITNAPSRTLASWPAAWLTGQALGFLVLWRGLAWAGRLPEGGRDAWPARAILAAAVPIGSLAAIHATTGEAGVAARPLAFGLLQGAAGLVGAALALVPGPASHGAPPATGGSGRSGRSAGPLLALAGGAAVLLLALSLALAGTEPRRPWREAPAGASTAAELPGLPNLVLVSIDTLRSDHVGAYGYERETTPALDALARQGALFERMIATAPWTLPSHGTLLTGRYPGDLPGYHVGDTPSLAPLLRHHGYRTAAFTAGYVMGESQFGAGFEFFAADFEEAYRLGVAPSFLQAGLRLRRGIRHLGLGFAPLNPVNHWRLEAGGVNAFAGPEPAGEAAADWIRDHAHQGPFFLFFHTFGAHEYYLATEAMRRGADRWAGDYRGWLRATSLRFGSELPRSAEELRYLVALYDASVRMSDDALGRVLAALEETGLARDTLVVVVSDHGEGFRPDLGRTWHLRRLHDDLLHVPLVMRLPGRIPAGARISAQASAVDLLPTALTLLGLESPEGIRGQSLVPLLGGVTPPTWRETAFSQVADHDPSHQGSSVRTLRHKYIRARESGEELYELERDPGELRNLMARGADAELPRLRGELDRFEGTISQETPELDDETEQQLRALGYVDGP
jgi:arylsulfatase A-like enzyme